MATKYIPPWRSSDFIYVERADQFDIIDMRGTHPIYFGTVKTMESAKWLVQIMEDAENDI